MENISFSILDFGLRESNMGSRRIQMDLLEYAIKADELGFRRFWLAEHYYIKKRLGWTSPEPLIPLIAFMTNNIRVGSAGILLGIHQPFHIAASFKLLNNLFPNRIDLGVANGSVQPIVAKSTLGVEDFQEAKHFFHSNLKELLHYLRDEEELYAEGEGVVLPPYKGRVPDVWSLSISNKSLQKVLDMKVNFARSTFHTGADLTPDKEILLEFKEKYVERHGVYPQVALAISGCCQKDSINVKRIMKGRCINSAQHLLCSVNEFYDRIMLYQEQFGINEFVFKDIARSSKDRLKTLEIISTKFNLLHNQQKLICAFPKMHKHSKSLLRVHTAQETHIKANSQISD